MKIEQLKRIYFVGIGGIGMSALARYFNSLGIAVFGYDKVETELTQKLVAEGMQVHYNDAISAIPEGIDLVVYTPAIPVTHKGLNYFFANDYTVLKRAAVLGLISKNRKTIAVAGTHGKTSTSAILTHILKVGGIDCNAFLGGIAQNFESNFVAGASDWVVMEADEYDRSFLHLYPEIAIITSMDADHLDIYGNEKAMHQTFFDFAKQVKSNLYYKEDLPLKANENIGLIAQGYGLEKGAIQANNIRVEGSFFVFDYQNKENKIEQIKFSLPGNHNVLNAIAAISVAKQLGCTDGAIKEALLTFKGIKRRFELVCQQEQGGIYIDDYAHHPEELKVAIEAAKMLYPQRKITGIFQPHLYSRTQDFAAEFARALDSLDECILLDIYPAREEPIKGVSSAIIFDKMKLENKQLVNKNALLTLLENKKIEVLMTLGAGDIGRLVEEIKELLIG